MRSWVLSCSSSSVEVTTCSRAAQPLYPRTVTSLPIDSSNRNLVINWCVKQLLIPWYGSIRLQEDTVHHTPSPGIRYDSAQIYRRVLYLNVPGIPGISRGSGECYRRTAAVRVDTIHHHQYTIAKNTIIRLGSTLPKDTLLDCTPGT